MSSDELELPEADDDEDAPLDAGFVGDYPDQGWPGVDDAAYGT